ncbi:MAG: hypothetical protein AAF684_01240 [Pseudomonadota bacterium]
MSDLPPLPVPTVQDAIDANLHLQVWCDFCRTSFAWTRADLEAWTHARPDRARRLAMELPRLRVCPRCGNHTLSGLFTGGPMGVVSRAG